MELYNINDKQINVIANIIANLSDSDLVSLNNEYCNTHNYMDDIIYDMSELDDLFSHLTPTEMAKQIGVGFNIDDDYFKVTIYGLESGEANDVLTFDTDDFANYLIDNGDVNNIMGENVNEIQEEFIDYVIKLITQNQLPYNTNEINDFICDNYSSEVYNERWEDLILQVFQDYKESLED